MLEEELILLLVVIIEILGENAVAFAKLDIAYAVQPPVTDGTALTPVPIARTLVPQFAACARSTLALS